MHQGIVKKYLKSERLHEILDNDLDLNVFVFAAMAQNVTNDWKDHRWWNMAKEVEIPMLWITSHVVVEGRHWSALGKVFGEILSITPSGTDSQIFTVTTGGDPFTKVQATEETLVCSNTEGVLEGSATT
jgi:hypothetical protein